MLIICKTGKDATQEKFSGSQRALEDKIKKIEELRKVS